MSKSASVLGLVFALWSCAGSSATPQGPATAGSEAGGAGANAGGTAATGGASGGSGGTIAHAGSGGSGTAGFAGTVGSGGSGTAGFAGAVSSGGSGAAGFAGGGSSSGGGSSLADVQAIFDSRCVSCHDKSTTGLPRYPQLSLVAADTLAALVNKAASEPCGGTLVVPGDPDNSYLIHKLSDTTPCDGMHMPRPFEVLPAPPLTAEQLTTIRSWISAGAKP